MLWVYISLYANNKSTLQAQAVRSKKYIAETACTQKNPKPGITKLSAFLPQQHFTCLLTAQSVVLHLCHILCCNTCTHSLSPALNWVFYAHGPVCSLKWCHVMMSLYFILALNDRHSVLTSETENWAAG